MEPLSEVLGRLKPRTYRLHGLDAGGDWAIRFPAHTGIKFDAVLQGSCWLSVEGESKRYQLIEGDCFLLTSGRPFVLASDVSLPARDAAEALTYISPGIARCQRGGDSFLIGGHFAFAGEHVDTLLGNLPAVLPVRAPCNEASVLRWALDLFAREFQNNQPGGSLTAEHLAHIMLIQVLRLHLASAETSGSGWLFALSDSQLSAAISAMHSEIHRRWTLETIARIAGMSRSSFAEKFKHVVGRSPLEYLTGWRMQVAGDRLRTTDNDIATIANEVGYASEAAFSSAFKKVHGHSPRTHRKTGHR